jgi:RHS repeat-associated protein
VPLGDLVHVLDGAGRHISTKSRERGLTLETLGYTDGLLSSVTDDEGRTTTISRAGNTVTIQAPDGKVTTLALADGYLDTVTGPDAAVIDLTHDEGGLLTHYVDRRGKAHDFVYDAQGRLVRDRGPDSPPEGGQTLVSSFADGTRTVVHRTAQGRAKVWELSRGPTPGKPQRLEALTVKQVTSTAPDGSYAFEATTNERYADMRDVTTYPDGHSQEVEQEPDPEYGVMGKVRTRTTLKASSTRTLVSTHTMVKQPNGSFTETSVRTSDSATSTRAYDGPSATEVRTSPEARVTTTTMDPAKERPTSVQVGPASGGNPQLFPVQYEYVASGLAAGKILRVTVGSRVTEYAYDAAGELVSITKPTGTTTFDLRDAVGRVTQQTMPGSRVLQTTYDGEGNAVSVIPPGGVSHGFGYSDAGPLASYTAPESGATPRTTGYTYDQDELLANVTSTDSRYDKTVSRDAVGRVTSVQWGTPVTRSLTFVYGNGHETNANVTGGVTLSRTYDQSLLTAETQTHPTKTALTLDRTYDTSVRLLDLKLKEGGVQKETLTLGYDKDDLVTSLRRTGASASNSLMLSRSQTGGLFMAADIGTPNVLREEMSYDGFGAPLEMRAKWGGAGMGQIGLTYDAAGRVATKVEAYAFPVVTPMAPMSNVTWTYAYDAAGRLVTATPTGSSPIDYTYDLRGNRNATAVDDQDRATQVGGPGQPDYTGYTYDAHGNVATRTVGTETQTYTWDGEGSLMGSTVTVTPPAPAAPTVITVTYDVDAKGRRVARRVNGTVERQWMYDGQLRIVGEVVYQAQVSYRVYGYVPERHLPVLMLETKNGVQTQYRIYGDHLGSMRAVVRVSDGKAVQVMRHGPWGELELDSVASGFARLPFGFAGGIHDDATKLVRFGAREYDARTGRWLSKDEARFGGGENFYEYAGGDPVNSVDLDGRKPSVARQALCLLLFHGYPALYTLCIGGDDGEDRDRAAGGAAGGNLPGNGGGERDDGICTLERDLREIPSCEPDKVTRYCQYYCPATGRKKTLVLPPPYSDQPCQTTIFGQSR